MKPVVKEWLDYAKKDLKAAEILISDPTLTATACFHSHQCVEKCLKAVIETEDQNPPKSHDLIRLYGMVEDVINLDEDNLAKLNEIYIDSRYPAGIGLLQGAVPTTEDASQLLEFARSAYDSIIRLTQD